MTKKSHILQIVAVLALFAVMISPLRAVETQVDLDGAKLVETYPNAKEYILKDGSKAMIWHSGTTKVTRPDGTVIQTWRATAPNTEEKRITSPDGTRESFFVGGGTKKTLPNGTIIETWPGTGEAEVKRVYTPDGTVESLHADGTRKVARKDGSETVTWPDGRIREVRPDGSIWTTSTAHRTVLNTRIIELADHSDKIGPDEKLILKGKMKPGYEDPWAAMLSPDDSVKNIPVEYSPKDQTFSIELKFDGKPGKYKVEIIGVGKYGNEIAANFPVWVGISPSSEPPKMYPIANPKTPIDVLERKFFDMVNALRRDKKVPEIAWDLEVAQLARNHARDMTQNGFFGHVSPTQGNLARRAITLFGWQTTVWGLPPTAPVDGSPNYIAEDLSRTTSLGDALDSLMESPAHRRVMVFPDFTGLGVGMSWGESSGDKMLYIVTAFIQKNRPTEAPKAQPPITAPLQPPGYSIYGRDNEQF